MTVPLRPQLRPLEIVPIDGKRGVLFLLRDPEGFGETLALPNGAMLLAMLMDGTRTLAEIQHEFKLHTGVQASLRDLEAIVRRLDEAYLLAGERFEVHRDKLVESYLGEPVRPASHAGGAYAAEAEELREQLAAMFTSEKGPGRLDPAGSPDGRQLCGVISPHIDLRRGGPAFAWAYKQVVEHGDADLFVIFGTAHHPMENLFCVSRKDFDTPLGIVRTDQEFIDRLAEHLASSVAGRQTDPFADELVHRMEHSIEFQAMFLQYVLGGKRDFHIVPVLVGSFEDFIVAKTSPETSPEVQAFVAAVRAAAAGHPGKVCYISGADLAHIGQQFSDEWLLDPKRLARLAEDDKKLLERACARDASGFYSHVADQRDRNRICGLSPTYTMLEVLDGVRGELLTYDQAVEPDGTSCVSFASVAFYRTPR